MKGIVGPALVLLFLSPAVGELLSGSAPPVEFFHPVGFVLLTVLYGGGAILIRELTQRWGKGWPTLLVLGAAYGIAEEALMCKSFFDPNWMDLNALQGYGRWVGVNWPWGVLLTIYHAVFSIAIPILLVGLIFPERRREPWIGRKTFWAVLALWIADGVFIYAFISAYRPPMTQFAVALLVTVGLVVLAWRLPKGALAARDREATRPLWCRAMAFTGTFCLFLIAQGLPNAGAHPMLTMGLMVGLVILVGWVVLRGFSGVLQSDRLQFALASGALALFILISPIQELSPHRPDNTSGMMLVGLAFLLFLFWLGRRIRTRERALSAPHDGTSRAA